jgi:hypothetical protein
LACPNWNQGGGECLVQPAARLLRQGGSACPFRTFIVPRRYSTPGATQSQDVRSTPKQDVPVQNRSRSPPPPPRLWGVPPKVGAQRLTWLWSRRPRGTVVVAVGRWRQQRGKRIASHIPARVRVLRSAALILRSCHPLQCPGRNGACARSDRRGFLFLAPQLPRCPLQNPPRPTSPREFRHAAGPTCPPTGVPLRDRSRRLSSSFPHPRRRLCVATHGGLGRDIFLALVWPRAL